MRHCSINASQTPQAPTLMKDCYINLRIYLIDVLQSLLNELSLQWSLRANFYKNIHQGPFPIIQSSASWRLSTSAIAESRSTWVFFMKVRREIQAIMGALFRFHWFKERQSSPAGNNVYFWKWNTSIYHKWFWTYCVGVTIRGRQIFTHLKSIFDHGYILLRYHVAVHTQSIPFGNQAALQEVSRQTFLKIQTLPKYRHAAPSLIAVSSNIQHTNMGASGWS